MNPSAHHKLKQSQVDFQKEKRQTYHEGYFATLILSTQVSSVTKSSHGYIMNNHSSTLMEHKLIISDVHSRQMKQKSLSTNADSRPISWERRDGEFNGKHHVWPNYSQEDELNCAVHSPRNPPAFAAGWTCQMYSTLK